MTEMHRFVVCILSLHEVTNALLNFAYLNP